ncbi:MAG: hypothetical protein K0R63_277 [Rickettsiales bacterium]|nr:hypothetical protein [Rickettsiales bacterium]
MATINFADLLGTTVSSFDVDNDCLSFAAGTSAADVTVIQGTSSVTFATAAGSVTLPVLLEEVTATNVSFADGSVLIVGDNTSGTSDDASANALTAVGTTNDDQIIGLAGADDIEGEGGADKLIGGLGNDTINGGDGADFITGNQGADSIVASDGADTVRGGQDDDTINYSTGGGANALYGDKGSDVITGGTAADFIRGGQDDDTINGGEGADDINGNLGDDSVTASNGADTVHGGQGADSISYATATSGAAVLYGDLGNDTLTGSTTVANTIYGGDDNDLITLSTAATGNFAHAELGDDTIIGGTGADSIRAGSGADSITAGGGNDTIFGGNGADTINSAGDGDVSISSGNGSDVLNLTLTGSTNTISISDYNTADTLNLISGTAATGLTVAVDENTNDVTIALTGSDTVEVAAVSGILTAIATNDGGYVVVNTGVAASLSGSIEGVADYLFAGNNGDTLNGGAGADSLQGGDGADSILGGSGIDTINGGDGNDIIRTDSVNGGGFADVVVAGAGDDNVYILDEEDDDVTGGEGTDTLHIGGDAGTYSFDGDAANNKINGFESIVVEGSATVTLDFDATYVTAGDIAATDTVTIDASAATASLVIDGTTDAGVLFNITGSTVGDNLGLSGLTKAATINGGAGADTIVGGTAVDSLIGGEGADSITGGDGADVIVLTESTSVADKVYYTAAVDTGTAGTLAAAQGDTITGFTTGTDKLGFIGDFLTAAMGGSVQNGTEAIAYGAGVDFDNAGTGDDTVFIIASGAATATQADLFDIADLTAALTGNTNIANADERVFIFNSQDGYAAIYKFVSAGADNTISAAELSLLGVVDENIAAGDIAFA